MVSTSSTDGATGERGESGGAVVSTSSTDGPTDATGSTGSTDGSADDSGDGATDGLAGERKVRAAAPRQVVMYLHLAEAALTGGDPVVRLERGNALVTAEQIRAWCGRPDTQITVNPVLDLDACTSSAGDRVTPAIAEKVAVRELCLPLVHPPGPQMPTPRASLRQRPRPPPHPERRHLVVVDPGTYVWTSPHGYQFLRDPIGILDISEDRPRLRHDGTRQPTGQDPSVAPARPPDT